MKLSEFITTHIEQILSAWEAFARTLLPGALDMGKVELRDHAKQMLEAIALDLETPQTGRQRERKSKGLAPETSGPESAASAHGTLREADGFTLLQLTSEFRALRASVLQLWREQVGPLGEAEIGDLFRFNEAIDQAIAESVVEYSSRASRSRDTLLAILGHDLRSPLEIIASAGEYLARPEARWGDLPGLGAEVRRNAGMMSGMVSDLLEYARSQLGGTLAITPEAGNLRDVAAEAVRAVNAVYPDCPFVTESEGPVDGIFDAARLRQAVTNLLTNAAQYRNGKHHVTVSLTGDDGHLTILVKNHGAVIPERTFEAIFNPLVQLAQPAGAVDRPETSLGLGLFIVREIATAHGGTVSVTSDAQEGTTFTLVLPRGDGQAARR